MNIEEYSRVPWDEQVWSSTRDQVCVLEEAPRYEDSREKDPDLKPTKKMLLEMIGILDGMERLVGLAEKEVLDSNPVLVNWLTSIRGLQRRMVKALERIGVRPVPSLGRPFDAYLHEAIEVRKEADLPPATVVEVREKPYRWGKRVLRVGKVVVTPKSPKNANSD